MIPQTPTSCYCLLQLSWRREEKYIEYPMINEILKWIPMILMVRNDSFSPRQLNWFLEQLIFGTVRLILDVRRTQ